MDQEFNLNDATLYTMSSQMISGNLSRVQMSPNGNRPLNEPLPNDLELLEILRKDPSSYISKISQDAYERILKTYK
jgi:hypothetical protein